MMKVNSEGVIRSIELTPSDGVAGVVNNTAFGGDEIAIWSASLEEVMKVQVEGMVTKFQVTTSGAVVAGSTLAEPTAST